MKKLKIIYDNTEIGINGNIFRMFPHFIDMPKDEIIYLDVKNIFLGNDGNIWDKFFYQPFSKNIIEINQKIKKKEYVRVRWDSKRDYEITYNDKITVYNCETISKYRDNFKKFIKFREPIIERVNNFKIKNQLENTLSIHLRGGDRFSTSSHAPNQRDFLNIENITLIINKYLDKKECTNIFLATDEEGLYLSLKKVYGDIIIKNDTYLAPPTDNRSVHKVGVFQSNEVKFRRGLDVLTDAMLMSQCKFSLFMTSQVSFLSLMLRDDFEYYFMDSKINYTGLD